MCVLVFCITGVLVYAYMSSVTKEVSNVFTPGDNIRARLSEPNWEEEEGEDLVPGKTVRKDPVITNTCAVSEYVAIRLTFQYADEATMSAADTLRLVNLLEISWNSSWVLGEGTYTADSSGKVTGITPTLVFYYNQILNAGEVSEPLFGSIRIKNEGDGLKEADLRWLQGIKIVDGETVEDSEGLGGFHIYIEGAAVQSLGYTDAVGASSALKALFP